MRGDEANAVCSTAVTNYSFLLSFTLVAGVALSSTLGCGNSIDSSGGTGGATGAGGAGSTSGSSTSASSGATTGSGGAGGATVTVGSGGAGGTGGGAPITVTVVAGTGESAFEPLGPSVVVPLNSGPQGGFHLWVALRCEGCGAEGTISYAVRDAATNELLTYDGIKQIVQFTDATPPWKEAAGIFGYLQSYNAADYIGRKVKFWVSVASTINGPSLGEAEADAVIGDVLGSGTGGAGGAGGVGGAGGFGGP